MSGHGAPPEFSPMHAHWSEWPAETLALLRQGTVIPAHPLALDAHAGSTPGTSARSRGTTSMPAPAAWR